MKRNPRRRVKCGGEGEGQSVRVRVRVRVGVWGVTVTGDEDVGEV